MRLDTRFKDTSRVQRKRARRTMWFWRGVLVSAVMHSFLAAADLSAESQSIWSDLGDAVDLHAAAIEESPRKIVEIELGAESSKEDMQLDSEKPALASQSSLLDGLRFSDTKLNGMPSGSLKDQAQVSEIVEAVASDFDLKTASQIQFPVDVPKSEVLRVSNTFHGMIQESMKSSVGQLSRQFLGSLSRSAPVTSEQLAELETTLIDEAAESDEGYALGQAVDSESEQSGLDPFKTYTVVNGRIHAVTPTQIARSASSSTVEASSQSFGLQGTAETSQPEVRAISSGDSAQTAVHSSERSVVGVEPSMKTTSAIEMPHEQVAQELSKIVPSSRSAALDANSAESDRVTIQGRVQLPQGFALDRAVLRVAGTAFQVQTDAAGAFELRDVPRGTRFELLVWHLDGSLTRRLIPVTASGREKNLQIALKKSSEIDQIATAFGTVHAMNQGGFCARVEPENSGALVGGRVNVTAGRKFLQAHFFSSTGLPVQGGSELTEDGRFCVFNVDETLVDVKVSLLNGVRRQFVVHVEPSTFEHDLNFDVAESMYRRVSLLEPLDTQQVLELSAQGVQPEFGDRRLRDWLTGDDVPVWTRVSRYLMQSDPAYSAVRPNSEDVQYFPGGQEFVEVRLSPDQPAAPWSRTLLSRDQLMTKTMLSQIETLKSRIYQDRTELMSVPAVDADAWDEIANQSLDLPHLQDQTVGGLYISIDPQALGRKSEELVVSVRDTWTGESVCKVVPLKGAKSVKSTRYLRSACGANPGQYALIIENKEGAMVWSDVVRIRPGDVQTVTVLDPKF